MAKKKKKVAAKAVGKSLSTNSANANQRTYTIPDYRLERPSFTIRQIRKGGEISYELSGDLSAPAPPIRDSKYLEQKAMHRDLPLDAAQSQDGDGARKSL